MSRAESTTCKTRCGTGLFPILVKNGSATRSEQVLSCKLDAAQRPEVPVDDRAPLANQLHAEVDSGHRAEDQIDVRRAGRLVEAAECPSAGSIGVCSLRSDSASARATAPAVVSDTASAACSMHDASRPTVSWIGPFSELLFLRKMPTQDRAPDPFIPERA